MTHDREDRTPTPPGETVPVPMGKERSSRTCGIGKWTIIGAIVVMLAASTLAVVSGNSLLYQDEKDYSELADSLLHKHQLAYRDGTLTTFRAPGYPFVLAAAYALAEQPLTAKLLNGLILGFSALLLALLARRIYPGSETLVPLLILAYPLILYESTLLYPQTLGCLLLGLVVLLVSEESPSTSRMAVAGIIYGLLVLTIPAFIPITPLFALFFLLAHKGSIARSLVKTSVFLLAIALVLSPWTLRNQATFGTFIPVSSNGGCNLLIGNSPLSSADSGMSEAVLAQCKTASKDMNEISLDRAYKQCAIDWITAEPSAAAKLYVAKLANYFNYKNQLTTSSQEAAWKFWIIFASYYPMLIVVILRGLLIRRIPFTRAESLVYLIYFGNAFASAIFFTRLRFRIPFDYLLIATEAAFLMRGLHALQKYYSPRIEAPHSLEINLK